MLNNTFKKLYMNMYVFDITHKMSVCFLKRVILCFTFKQSCPVLRADLKTEQGTLHVN